MSDVWMKFKDQRRAVVNVRGNLYGAILVDLPCIIEANKTIDKKNIFKAADICQMLLVVQRIAREDDVAELKTGVADLTYPHGLTPPMQHARKRRFKKRIDNRTIEMVEAEVDRLLFDDEAAESSRFSLGDAAELNRDGTASEAGDNNGGEGYDLLGDGDYDDEQDAEGDVDVDYEFASRNMEDTEMDEATLANDLDSALFNATESGDKFVAEDMVAGKSGAASTIKFPIANVPTSAAAAAEESETSDEEEEEDLQPPSQPPQEPALDEAAQEALQQKEKLREEIQDLEEMIGTKVREYEKMGNAMLKARVGRVIAGFRTQLEVKQDMLAQLG